MIRSLAVESVNAFLDPRLDKDLGNWSKRRSQKQDCANPDGNPVTAISGSQRKNNTTDGHGNQQRAKAVLHSVKMASWRLPK